MTDINIDIIWLIMSLAYNTLEHSLYYLKQIK